MGKYGGGVEGNLRASRENGVVGHSRHCIRFRNKRGERKRVSMRLCWKEGSGRRSNLSRKGTEAHRHN